MLVLEKERCVDWAPELRGFTGGLELVPAQQRTKLPLAGLKDRLISLGSAGRSAPYREGTAELTL